MAWAVGRCQHVRVGWCVSPRVGVCMSVHVYREQYVHARVRGGHATGTTSPADTPCAVCLQGNRGRLGVVVAAYMHYSNISAR